MEEKKLQKAIKKEVAAMYPVLVAYMERKRPTTKKHWAKSHLAKILLAQASGGDYSEIQKTTLYNKYGGEYCQLLEGIALYQDNKLK